MTALMNPFDVLPPTLFNVLGSQGGLQRHYLATLLRIYGMAEFNRFGLTRDMVVAEVVDSLNSNAAEGVESLYALAEFHPSVGIPATLAAQVERVTVDAARVVCVENLTPFYTLVQQQGRGLAALCLWGNPSPASRHLLRTLVAGPSRNVPLLLWPAWWILVSLALFRMRR